jgi:uncharacterized secreted protein with C-terminal beta-propeller domain
LHPYDEDHIIGVGIDGSNVKIMLFDVSDVNAPTNVSEYKITGYTWSDTPVLTEHKAFLFDKTKNLLVIPIKTSYYTQDAYVFNITLSNGLVLKGNITHQNDSVYYFDSNYWVTRALYIENVLYTMSNNKIKMNDLETLALINAIELR